MTTSTDPRRLFSSVAAAIVLAAVPIAASAQDGSGEPESEAANPYLENVTADNAVFVAVDYLTGFQPAIRTMDRDLYQNNLTGLARMIAAFDMPVIVLGDEGPPRGSFMPQMEEYFGEAAFVGRSTPSAWREADFREAVEATGRRKLVLAGISTDNCTLLTALDAMRDGYEVYVVADVSGAESQLIEDVALTRLVQAGAVPITWVSLGSELLIAEGGWESEVGGELSQIYRDHTLWFQQ